MFENFGVSTPRSEVTKQVMDVTRPNLTFDTVTLDVYNSRVYAAGKHTWEPITLTLRDDVNNSVSKLVGEQIQKQFDFLEQSSAPSGINYKFQLIFDMLDGGNGNTTPNVLESWELDGCFLSSVDYGDLAYSSSDPVQIACNIKFDNAIQTVGGGVGTSVVTLTPGDSVN